MLWFKRLALSAPLMAVLAGCGDLSDETGGDTPPPTVVVETVLQSTPGGTVIGPRRFLGRVDAVSTVDLSFQVGGKVAKLPVLEGEIYPKDTVLAELDKTTYNLAVQEAEASYELAQADLERKKTLVQRSAASQAQLDASQADFRLRTVALDRARLNLSYTTLEAPFDAMVSRRLTEIETNVTAGTPILRIQDVSELRVKISVPEDLMRDTVEPESFDVRAFDKGIDGTEYEFPLEFRENNTEPDEVTRTFTVTFGMPGPEEIELLPGMTVSVVVTPKVALGKAVVSVSLSAVVTAPDGSHKVWIYDEATGMVTGRPVVLGPIAGERVIVTSGLEAGETIVSAGAGFLRDGMTVRLLNGEEG